jgi:starch-binding outer membrane protein, SusD/RagB family
MTRPAHMTSATAASLLVGTLLSAACMDLNVPDLNNPLIEDFESHPTRAGVITATQGLFIGARGNIAAFNGYVGVMGVLGRESYIWNAGDPRFITELLRGPLDGGSPRFGGNLWYERLANIRNGSIVLNALGVLGTTPPLGMTNTEKAATRGFVETMEALDFLLLINVRDTLGAPVDVNRDVNAALAPFVTRDSVYGYIVGLLNAATANLAAGGSAFPFSLPAGFSGFTTPTTFIAFNRALKARVEAYRATLLACGAPCWTRARSALDSSFLSVTADTLLKDAADSVGTAAMLARGAYYDFGSGSGDATNALYDPPGDNERGHPSLRQQADTQANGTRDRRFRAKVDSIAPGAGRIFNHTSDMAFSIYKSVVAQVPIIRKEELILLRAEAELGLGNPAGAAALINYIRVNSGRVPARAALAVAPTDTIVTELLKQRVYSLLFEGGHRWIDARRYGRLATLPNPVAGDNIFRVMPVPSDECSARGLGANCTPLTP